MHHSSTVARILEKQSWILLLGTILARLESILKSEELTVLWRWKRSIRYYIWSDFGIFKIEIRFFQQHIFTAQENLQFIRERDCPIEKHFKSTLKNAIFANGSCRIYTHSPTALPKSSLGLFREIWGGDRYHGRSINNFLNKNK